ncbi:Rv3235 family protein [Microbacteriaceae bacterium 4G12]
MVTQPLPHDELPPRGAVVDRAATAGRFDVDDFFGHQPSRSAELPPPEPLIENLTRCVIEVLAGARDLDQIARWVSDDVYRHLLKRVVLSARARRVKGRQPTRPSFSMGPVSLCRPRDGVVEAVVVVHSRARSRAVAVRLEGLDRRWRATAIHVL